MYKNYLKIALRNLLKYKAYSLINILGLAVGMAATMVIALYIKFELRYDRFHENAGRLYRVSVIHTKEGKVEYDSPQFTPPIGPAMAKEFPEIENFVRISTPKTAYFNHGDNPSKIRGIVYADSSFFEVFSFKLIAGNPRTALANPYSMVITKETARRIFGADDPLGKTLELENKDDYKVTGIIAEAPDNSSIQYNALISFSTLYNDPNLFLDWDGGNQYYTYVLLREHARPEEVEKKFPDFMWRHINEKYASFGASLNPYLQPLREIHLRYNEFSDFGMTNIYIFSAIALLILLIAAINFINLTTARATKRAKEIGVRKVLGANQKNLVRQFLGESILLSLIGFAVALFLVELLLPLYRQLLDKQLTLSSLVTTGGIVAALSLVLVIGMAAGSYPALYLSSFQAVRTLKGVSEVGKHRSRARNVLVVVQFAISITLFISTLLIDRQLDFVKTRDLGFNKENIVVLPLVSDRQKSQSEILKTELATVPKILGIAASSEVPYNGFTSNGYLPEGVKNPIMIHVVDADEDFLRIFAIGLTEGRNFSKDFPTDKSAFLINASLAKLLSWDQPVGKTITRDGVHTVIGVVKDFHYASMHSKIEPLIITNHPWRDQFDLLSIKIAGGDIPETLNAIKTAWAKWSPGAPFDYFFLDESFDTLYKSEQRFQQIFFCFSILAIFVACLGLFGLASFSIEQRTKEIGIRKVLGASVTGIVGLLAREFARLVLLANLIAWPVGYIFMNRWLQDFAYRIHIGLLVFMFAGGLALLIALLTVILQAIRAALANPVEALRYE